MAASRLLNEPRSDSPSLNNMIENKPSKNLWALSSLASTIGAGDFAIDDYDSFRRQEFVFAALNLLLIGRCSRYRRSRGCPRHTLPRQSSSSWLSAL